MKLKQLGLLLLILATFLVGCSSEKSAKSYYKDGMKYYKEGNYEEAKNSLLLASKTNPNKAEYMIEYGLVLIRTGDYNESLKQFDQAILKNDNKIVTQNNKRAHRGKGIAYYYMSDYKNALVEFETALNITELEELNTDIMYYKADCEEKSGEYQKAIDTYTTMIKNKKKDALLYSKRAHAYQALGDMKKALLDYDKAISIEPKELDLYVKKYLLYQEQEDIKSANKTLEHALKITKDKNYYDLGRIYYYQGNTEQAISNFHKALKDEKWKAYFYLGEIYVEQKDYEQGIENYKSYIEKNPDSKDGIVYNQLATCLIAINEYEEALDYIGQGLKQNDNTAMKALKFNEIIAYERLIQFDKAYTKIKEYLKSYPDDQAALREIEFIKTRVKE